MLPSLLDSLFGWLRGFGSLVQVDVATGWTGTEMRGVMCETAGLLRVDSVTLGTGIYVPVAAGVPIAIRITKVYATAAGTTVTGRIVVGS